MLACDIGAIAYTQGPGLAGALLVGAAFAESLAMALGVPTVPVHHLEGHLLSPAVIAAAGLPLRSLLVSGGHTQLMRVTGWVNMHCSASLDDAAGETSRQDRQAASGCRIPAGRRSPNSPRTVVPARVKLPRPMLNSGDLMFSFSGLKTAVVTQVRERTLTDQDRADIACGFQEAIVEVLVKKAMKAVAEGGLSQLVVAGGVSANRELRRQLDASARRRNVAVYYPELNSAPTTAP